MFLQNLNAFLHLFHIPKRIGRGILSICVVQCHIFCTIKDWVEIVTKLFKINHSWCRCFCCITFTMLCRMSNWHYCTLESGLCLIHGALYRPWKDRHFCNTVESASPYHFTAWIILICFSLKYKFSCKVNKTSQQNVLNLSTGMYKYCNSKYVIVSGLHTIVWPHSHRSHHSLTRWIFHEVLNHDFQVKQSSCWSHLKCFYRDTDCIVACSSFKLFNLSNRLCQISLILLLIISNYPKVSTIKKEP